MIRSDALDLERLIDCASSGTGVPVYLGEVLPFGFGSKFHTLDRATVDILGRRRRPEAGMPMESAQRFSLPCPNCRENPNHLPLSCVPFCPKKIRWIDMD